MAELIHHTDESADGGASPFDSAIREIVADENVLIVCPYITVEYLEPILRNAGSWRLLTDVEAWLSNYSKNKRESIRGFIARYHERIHDIRNLHAKAIIGETDALVGSANLTRTGLRGRDELAVRFDEPERIGNYASGSTDCGLRARQRNSTKSTSISGPRLPYRAVQKAAVERRFLWMHGESAPR